MFFISTFAFILKIKYPSALCTTKKSSKTTIYKPFHLGWWPAIFSDHETFVSVKVVRGNDTSYCILFYYDLFSIKLILVIEKFMKSKSKPWNFLYLQEKHIRFRSSPPEVFF